MNYELGNSGQQSAVSGQRSALGNGNREVGNGGESSFTNSKLPTPNSNAENTPQSPLQRGEGKMEYALPIDVQYIMSKIFIEICHSYNLGFIGYDYKNQKFIAKKWSEA
jgi:hypothetical protein